MSTGTNSVRAGPLVQALIILYVKMRYQIFVRRLWKPHSPGGVMSLFGYCIKIKAHDNMAEAYAMQFVAQQTSIPVPKLICAFMYKNCTYIVMSRIKGRMIFERWRERSDESKRRIFEQLRVMITELRSIPVPDGIGVGSVTGGPFYDCRLPTKHHWGPFSTVRAFHQELANGIDPDLDYEDLPERMPELFRFYRQASNTLVFTHGDLSSFNIMVQDDKVAGIIDWEMSGWLPMYWEYSCAKDAAPLNTFWAEEIDHFLTPMPYEFEMEMIRRRYFGDF